jgi:hypothetical protein
VYEAHLFSRPVGTTPVVSQVQTGSLLNTAAIPFDACGLEESEYLYVREATKTNLERFTTKRGDHRCLVLEGTPGQGKSSEAFLFFCNNAISSSASSSSSSSSSPSPAPPLSLCHFDWSKSNSRILLADSNGYMWSHVMTFPDSIKWFRKLDLSSFGLVVLDGYRSNNNSGITDIRGRCAAFVKTHKTLFLVIVGTQQLEPMKIQDTIEFQVSSVFVFTHCP